MYKRIISVLCILVFALSLGCSRKYTKEEYDSVSQELKACKSDLAIMKQENNSLKKFVVEKEKELEETSSQALVHIDEKQRLMDKNIQCLEENKALLKQISRFQSLVKEKKQSQWRLNKAYEYILAVLETERLNDLVYIIKSPDEIKIVLPQRSLYPTSRSAWLTPKGTKLVEKIGQGLEQMNPVGIDIAGHTDNSSLKVDKKKVYPTNWHLSQARSISVLMVFRKMGIPKDKLSAVAYGETRPIADINSEEGRSMNRRVEIVIHP